MDEKNTSSLYELAKKFTENDELVSTAKLQRYLQIPYTKARLILDKMIAEGFCGAQLGAQPCKILIKKN